MVSNVADVVLWLSVGLIIYVYVGYPALIYILARLWGRPVKKKEWTPSVSLIIAAYNEEDVIREKLENTLQLDYPGLEVLVFSDGSTDATDAIVREYEDKGVKLLRYEGRKGKTYCQNESIKEASGEIIVFSDANSMYEKNAIHELVKPFADKEVGAVCGELNYVTKGFGENEGLYWRIEKFMKRQESQFKSCIGANGAIYAVLKKLYVPLHHAIISDLVEPLHIVQEGHRVVYQPRASCTESASLSDKIEFRRKVRIILRSLNGVWSVRGLLNPFKYGVFSLMIWSHKVLRWLVPVFILLVFVGSFVSGFLWMILLQVLFYLSALIGFFVPKKPFSIVYYFCLVNLSCAVALVQFVVGKNKVVWDTKR